MTFKPDDLARALEDHVRELMHLRRCSESQAWGIVAQTAAENVRLEFDTSGEAYWKAVLRIADGRGVA